MGTLESAKPATAGAVDRLAECDRLGGAIVSEDSAHSRCAAILDRSRQSWERIASWQLGIIEDLTAQLADRDDEIVRLRRQVEIYRRLIADFDRQKEARCTH